MAFGRDVTLKSRRGRSNIPQICGQCARNVDADAHKEAASVVHAVQAAERERIYSIGLNRRSPPPSWSAFEYSTKNQLCVYAC
jgi:hypothetical protein